VFVRENNYDFFCEIDSKDILLVSADQQGGIQIDLKNPQMCGLDKFIGLIPKSGGLIAYPLSLSGAVPDSFNGHGYRRCD